MKKIITLLLLSTMAFSLVGCSQTEGDVDGEQSGIENQDSVAFDVQEFWLEAQSNLDETEVLSTTQLDDQMLSSIYGLDDTLVAQHAVFMPNMSTQIDETLIVEAQEGKLELVKEKINERLVALQSAAFYPDQIEFVNAPQMSENGNFIIFSVGHHAEKYIQLFDSKFN